MLHFSTWLHWTFPTHRRLAGGHGVLGAGEQGAAISRALSWEVCNSTSTAAQQNAGIAPEAAEIQLIPVWNAGTLSVIRRGVRQTAAGKRTWLYLREPSLRVVHQAAHHANVKPKRFAGPSRRRSRLPAKWLRAQSRQVNKVGVGRKDKMWRAITHGME